MKYSAHRSKKSGHIELREESESGFHRRVIAPNEPFPNEYKEQIEADPDFEKYRTAENEQAYLDRIEAHRLAEQPGKEELQRQAEAEADRIALQEIISERKEAGPLKSARDIVKAKIADGTITENPGKEIRDEVAKAR